MVLLGARLKNMNDLLIHQLFANKKIKKETLTDYGFQQIEKGYVYTHPLMDGQFELRVQIDSVGEIFTQVIDLDTQEPYILHLLPAATGVFVGEVRQMYETILTDIAEKCFETTAFQEKTTLKLIQVLQNQYQTKLEFLWPKSPRNAIMRRPDNQKWYIAFLTVRADKLHLSEKAEEQIEIINIRVASDILPNLIDNYLFFPAYHMNKKNWVTIYPARVVDEESLMALIEKSYQWALNKSAS